MDGGMNLTGWTGRETEFRGERFFKSLILLSRSDSVKFTPPSTQTTITFYTNKSIPNVFRQKGLRGSSGIEPEVPLKKQIRKHIVCSHGLAFAYSVCHRTHFAKIPIHAVRRVSWLFLPSRFSFRGPYLVLFFIISEKSTPSMLTPSRSAPLRSVLLRVAPLKSAFLRLAPLRSAPPRQAPLRSASSR